MKKNENLLKEIAPSDSELKEIIVNYVGETLNPESENINVEQIIEVFATQFPEFLLAIAEENWVNGYTQALNDVDYVTNAKSNNKTRKKNVTEELPENKKQD